MPTNDFEPLFKAASAGDTERVKQLLAQGADPTALRSAALAVSARRGHPCVALLAPFDHDPDVAAFALGACAEHGFLDAVRILFPKASRSDQRCPLERAATLGRLECVQWLAERSPQANARQALIGAANGPHPECVEALAPWAGRDDAVESAAGFALELAAAQSCERSCRALLTACDPSIFARAALRQAIHLFDMTIARLLIPHCDTETISRFAHYLTSMVAADDASDFQCAALVLLAQSLPARDQSALFDQALKNGNARVEKVLGPLAHAWREDQALRAASAFPMREPRSARAL
jgi:hypothetical protein